MQHGRQEGVLGIEIQCVMSLFPVVARSFQHRSATIFILEIWVYSCTQPHFFWRLGQFFSEFLALWWADYFALLPFPHWAMYIWTVACCHLQSSQEVHSTSSSCISFQQRLPLACISIFEFFQRFLHHFSEIFSCSKQTSLFRAILQFQPID